MSSAAEILANINTYVGVGASWIGIAVVGQDGVAAAATSIGEKVRPGWRRLRRFLPLGRSSRPAKVSAVIGMGLSLDPWTGLVHYALGRRGM
jgi:hypothetical protein